MFAHRPTTSPTRPFIASVGGINMTYGITTRRILPAAVLAALAALLAVFVGAAPPASSSTVQLPDLRMAKLTNIKLDTTTLPGHRLLRYTAQLVNTGTGPFEAHGLRSDTSTAQLPVTQRIYDDAGGFVDQAIPGTTMFWAGDGHNHWHITDLEEGTLVRSSTGQQVGTLVKHGFHLVDDFAFSPAVPGAPASQVYTKCGGNSCDINALDVMMGISVGWVDRYNYTTVGQYIDITGLPNGKYVLTATVDPSHWFTESDPSNNWASATLRLGTNGVQKLSYSGGI
jgi:hypothetical protein